MMTAIDREYDDALPADKADRKYFAMHDAGWAGWDARMAGGERVIPKQHQEEAQEWLCGWDCAEERCRMESSYRF